MLMETSPEKAVAMWINHPKLNPRHLIPALLRYNHAARQDRASEVTQKGNVGSRAVAN